MIWFTSDYHFGHTNIAGKEVSRWSSGYRDFKSVYDMNKELTRATNAYVKSSDILYFLGDFSFGDQKSMPSYRHSLVCETIHLHIGNHDKHVDKHSNLFTSIQDVSVLSYPPVYIFMSHYAHRVWPAHHKGAIHLYGHSHGSIIDHGKSMDVGVDAAYKLLGEYRPFSIDEITSIMNKKEIVYSDGHKTRK